MIGAINIFPKTLALVNIVGTSFTLRNSDEKLTLADPNDNFVDNIEIPGAAKQGSSYNKSKDNEWSWSRFTTPNKENKINNLPKIEIKKPDDVYKDMKAEFDASDTSDKDGDDLKFRWDFGDGHYSYLEKTSHTYDKKGEYKIILRVDDGSVQIFKEFYIGVGEYPEYDIKIIRLLPNPTGVDAGNEEIGIKNNSKKKINLKDWKIATGSEEKKAANHPIYEDEIVDAGEIIIIKNIDCHFALPNKTGVAILRYPNDKDADEVSYEKDKIEDDQAYILTADGWFWTDGVNKKSEPETSEAVVLGVHTMLSEKLGNDFWQKIMSDVWNRKTFTMRGLMAFNWIMREQKWGALAVAGFY